MISPFVTIRTLLLADADVIAVTTTIKPRVPQEPTFPLITIKKISGEEDESIDYSHPRMQVTAWADNYEDGEQLALKIKYALQRYKGVVAGMDVKGIIFLNDTHVYDPETGRETFPADYKLNYMEE